MKTLVIRGQAFECRDDLPPWMLMKMAKAHRSGDVMTIRAVEYDFLTTMAIDRQTLEAFLDVRPDITSEEFNQAIGDLITAYSERPTERPSASPDGQSNTGQSSRVVSLSRGTDREAEISSRDGESAAS